MKKRRAQFDENKKFGIENDGWDKKDLDEFLDWVCDVDRAAYDIRNCRRGAYCKDIGDDMTTLVEHLELLSDELDEVIEVFKNQIEREKR